MHAQLVVLGGGPGGYAAAFLAADAGLPVVLVEAEPRLGGTCLLRGCIPSKALLHVARVLAEVEELRTDWGVEFSAPQINVERIRARQEKLIANLSGGLAQLAKRRQVTVIRAKGVLQDSNSLRLEGSDPSIPSDGLLTFDRLILASGSVPVIPPAFDLGSPRVMDSTAALRLEEIPPRLLVVGGGYIGLELGLVFAQFGSQVSVAELTDSLMPGVDRDLVKPLQKRLAKLFGDRIHLNTKVGSLTVGADAVEVSFEGPGKMGVEHFDRVLVSVGRKPASRGLGLENTRVQLNERGFVICNRRQQTGDPNILAIGDVAGEPMLAHKATHEARIAVDTLLGKPPVDESAAIPAVVFTDPEIAWVGLTEEQAKREGLAFEVAMFPWVASGRAQVLGRTEGLTKWLVDPASQRILGCGIVGPSAGELISEATLAITAGCRIGDLTKAIHPHPTLSETLPNAGEIYFGSAIDLYKPKRPR